MLTIGYGAWSGFEVLFLLTWRIPRFLALPLGITALVLIFESSFKFTGRWMAIAGIVTSFILVPFGIIGLVGYSRDKRIANRPQLRTPVYTGSTRPMEEIGYYDKRQGATVP
jgi:hypothetical protein